MTTVLILAREEVVAALLGLLVELCGLEPAYLQKGEGAAEACARLGCAKVVIDCDHWECSTKTLSPVQRSGAKIVLFSPSRVTDDMRRTAAALKARTFALPIGPDAFGKLLA